MSATDALVADYLDRLARAAAGLPPERRTELLEGIGEHIASARADGRDDEAAVRTTLDRLGQPEEIVAAAGEDLPPATGGGATPPGEASGGWGAPATGSVPRSTGHELAAVLMLTLGSFLPVVGWVVGVVLLWTSSLWRTREKVLATLVVPLGPGGILLLGAFSPLVTGTEVCSSGAVRGAGEAPDGPLPLPPPPPAAPPPQPAPPPGTDRGSVVFESEMCTVEATSGWLVLAVTALVVLAPIVVAAVLLRVARRRAQAQPVLVPEHGPGVPRSPWGALEVAAVLTLGLGGLLVPVAGALVGLVLVCVSPRWTVTHKVAAWVLVVLPIPLLVTGVPIRALQAPGVLSGYLLVLAASGIAAVYLALVLPRGP